VFFKETLLEKPLVDINGNMVNQQDNHPMGGKGNTFLKADTIGKMKKNFDLLLADSENKVLDVSEKLDGSSLYLTYDSLGRLIKAVTRGDGKRGEDVTVNALKIPSIPNTIDVSMLDLTNKDRVQIRGEVIFLKDKFEETNKDRELSGKKKYSNPRNSTAGIMGELSGENCKNLDFMMFELLKVNNFNSDLENVSRFKFNDKKYFNKNNSFLQPKSFRYF
jgi:NAD-dependent DNA ligase